MISNKILKNTLMLYSRQVLLIIVNLYSMRVVLNTLGVEEFGIYSVVAGIVTLCSFLNGSMASTTQRFFSYAIGKKNDQLLKSTFSVNLIIYLVIGFLVLFLLETIGFWFVNNYLNIPVDRMDSAITLYHYTVFSFLFGVIVAPFVAIIIAHEDMHIFAMVSVFEAVMKLLVVFSLIYLTGDKLELYGLLLLFVSICISFIYIFICKNKYFECQFRQLFWDKFLLKEILSFTGWTIFGQITTVIRYQAVTILLNQFFNPTVVAARAIAITVSSQINLFSNNFNTGMYPSIVKYYANEERKEFFSLIFNGSKLTFFLMWVFVLPLLVEMDFVLSLWLGLMPESTVFFVKLALIESLIISVSLPLATAARAHGKMKVYELSLGLMQISIFFTSYVFLSLGFPAFSVFIVAIAVNLLMLIVRIVIVSKQIELSIMDYIRKVIIPIFYLIVVSSISVFLFKESLPQGVIFSVLNILFGVIIATISMYYIGLDSEWRHKTKMLIMSKMGY